MVSSHSPYGSLANWFFVCVLLIGNPAVVPGSSDQRDQGELSAQRKREICCDERIGCDLEVATTSGDHQNNMTNSGAVKAARWWRENGKLLPQSKDIARTLRPRPIVMLQAQQWQEVPYMYTISGNTKLRYRNSRCHTGTECLLWSLKPTQGLQKKQIKTEQSLN